MKIVPGFLVLSLRCITSVWLCFSASGCIARNDAAAVNIDPFGWEVSEPAVIEFENDDTVSVRDLSFFIRHTRELTPLRFPVSIWVTAPDSTVFNENFTFDLSFTYDGNRDISEADIPYRRNAVLGMRGTYIFTVATSLPGVKGVSALGIRSSAAGDPPGNAETRRPR